MGNDMKKIDPTVKKETAYIGISVLILSALMQAVFLIIGKWDYTLLLGNIFGGAVAVLNFFLMGLTVQSALGKEEKDARNTMKLSQMGRLLLLFAVAMVANFAPVFDLISTVIPFVFPRIAIMFRPVFNRRLGGDANEEK